MLKKCKRVLIASVDLVWRAELGPGAQRAMPRLGARVPNTARADLLSGQYQYQVEPISARYQLLSVHRPLRYVAGVSVCAEWAVIVEAARGHGMVPGQGASTSQVCLCVATG